MSRYRHHFGFLAFPVLLVSCGPAVPSDSAGVSARDASAAPAAIFGPALTTIQDSVRIPIRLPATLPAVLQDPEINEARGLITPGGYSVELRYGGTPGDAGSAAYFSGSTDVFHLRDNPAARPLRLANGVEGMFAPVSCGGSCNGPHLWWEQDGVMYGIEIDLPTDTREAEQERVVLEAANAMVRASPPTPGRAPR